MKPTLAIIDVDIFSGQDELVREALLENLRRFHDPCLTVLWINWLRERADLRVVCLVHDLEQFDNFLVNVVRKVPGVRGTAAQLAFDGVVRGDALMDLSLLNAGWDRRAAATVQVKLQPGRDEEAYQALLALPKHQQVEVVWVVKVFHSNDADVLMLLLGERTAALTGYVMSWVRTVPGVLDTHLSSVLDWQILGRTEDFIALARRFPDPQAKPAMALTATM
ncbi:MAG: Lrp/AsnC ligand binding domain-containing protein [Anaerolineae bacterium]|nr:Lrp/AsnC ligand binding domain-containing protein [Anaerolineae bacterium]